ncbi:hypothetical protein G6L33_22865 [Agrobacterium rhizogenes]|nr:hypothetical protein [Rhizobium rhizogenes]NTH66704.1 hypothetical protein [Rhizobium rhizogenes]
MAVWLSRIIGTTIALLLSVGAAVATDRCQDIKVAITDLRKQEYGALVASAMETKIKASQVRFYSILESGVWSAAYVSTPASDDGVMFFETVNGKKRFRDVWGGWADPSEIPELIAWAKKLGVSKDIASCFAKLVTGGN